MKKLNVVNKTVGVSVRGTIVRENSFSRRSSSRNRIETNSSFTRNLPSTPKKKPSLELDTSKRGNFGTGYRTPTKNSAKKSLNHSIDSPSAANRSISKGSAQKRTPSRVNSGKKTGVFGSSPSLNDSAIKRKVISSGMSETLKPNRIWLIPKC
jgi:hypothetical protein